MPRDASTEESFVTVDAEKAAAERAAFADAINPDPSPLPASQAKIEVTEETFHAAVERAKKEALFNPTPFAAVKPKKKIAILGTTPTWQMAPFDDPSWEIWGIFGVALVSKRLTRLYELHKKEIIEAQVKTLSPDGRYWEVCRKMGKDFITRDAYDQAPEATRFDFDAKLKKYGKYFASSASWIMADAIDAILADGDPAGAEIAIYGINMAADEEYIHQKPSLTYMIGFAKAKGIKISIPESSELLSISHQYGYEDPPRFMASMAQRKHEINQALAQAQATIMQGQVQLANAQGAMNQILWFEQNFNAEHRKDKLK